MDTQTRHLISAIPTSTDHGDPEANVLSTEQKLQRPDATRTT